MMDMSVEYGDRGSFEFATNELTGALGDSVTVLPVVVAVAALTPLDLAHLLLGFAAFQVVWGLHYGAPVSVEPMKALAALTIAGSLSGVELAVAGLAAGVALLVVGATGMLGHVERHVGEPVVRGVQFGVALVLLETGLRLSLDGVTLAAVAAAVVLVAVALGHRRASALAVLVLGGALAALETGLPAPAIPTLSVSTLSSGAVDPLATAEATLGQLAMTVGNAAVATSLLLSDYFDADVSPDELATSMGVMNLLAVPLGAMPMCHGSGGVAGKYAFGARTAGANLILGGVYALLAVAAVGLVAAFPMAVLGVVLVVVALQLARSGLDTGHYPLTVAIGLLGLVTNVGVAFVAGVLGYAVLNR